jgi:hypothetical protein
MPHVSRGIGILVQSMVRERRALLTSLALQLEKICLRRIILAVPKVAQPDANQPITLLRTKFHSFS